MYTTLVAGCLCVLHTQIYIMPVSLQQLCPWTVSTEADNLWKITSRPNKFAAVHDDSSPFQNLPYFPPVKSFHTLYSLLCDNQWFTRLKPSIKDKQVPFVRQRQLLSIWCQKRDLLNDSRVKASHEYTGYGKNTENAFTSRGSWFLAMSNLQLLLWHSLGSIAVAFFEQWPWNGTHHALFGDSRAHTLLRMIVA